MLENFGLISFFFLGASELRTIPAKRPSSPGGILGGGWCANCRNPRRRQNTHHPQFCTRDVDCPFCGGWCVDFVV